MGIASKVGVAESDGGSISSNTRTILTTSSTVFFTESTKNCTVVKRGKIHKCKLTQNTASFLGHKKIESKKGKMCTFSYLGQSGNISMILLLLYKIAKNESYHLLVLHCHSSGAHT